MAVGADVSVGAWGFKLGQGEHMGGESELGLEGWLKRNSRCMS